jgi:hypothetical protein
MSLFEPPPSTPTGVARAEVPRPRLGWGGPSTSYPGSWRRSPAYVPIARGSASRSARVSAPPRPATAPVALSVRLRSLRGRTEIDARSILEAAEHAVTLWPDDHGSRRG